MKNLFLALFTIILLVACDQEKPVINYNSVKSIYSDIALLGENTAYSLISVALKNAVVANRITEPVLDGKLWVFTNLGSYYDNTEHTIHVDFESRSLFMDGVLINPSSGLKLFTKELGSDMSGVDPFISSRLLSSASGTVYYQQGFSSIEEVNRLLLEREVQQNLFNLSEVEILKVVFSFLKSEYTIEQFAVLGADDYYVKLKREEKSFILYYTNNALIVGGFLFNDSEGLLF